MPISVRFTKRLLDILISSGSLIILSPVLFLVAIMIKLDSPGPILYSQRRVLAGGGRHPNEFDIYKFRTMHQNAEEMTGAVNAEANDPRVTRVGNILRPIRIDELPNLINVLIGQMSVVGPRADRVEIFKEVENTFPLVWDRTKFVKPGITGPAQIYLRSDGSLAHNTTLTEALPDVDKDQPVDSFRYKLYYDFSYAIKLSKFWSFLKTDIMIMIKTPIVMFFRKNTI